MTALTAMRHPSTPPSSPVLDPKRPLKWTLRGLSQEVQRRKNQLLYRRARRTIRTRARSAWDGQVPTPGSGCHPARGGADPPVGRRWAIGGYAITTSAADLPPAASGGAQPHRATRPSPGSRGCSWTTRSARLVDGWEVQSSLPGVTSMLAFSPRHRPFVSPVRTSSSESGTVPSAGWPALRGTAHGDVHVSRLRRKLGPCYGACLAPKYRAGTSTSRPRDERHEARKYVRVAHWVIAVRRAPGR